MGNQKINSSDLFRQPTFLRGYARASDLFGNLTGYRYSGTEEHADSEAITQDWTMVGNDIKSSISNYESTCS